MSTKWSFAFAVKTKIQDEEGIPLGQQRLIGMMATPDVEASGAVDNVQDMEGIPHDQQRLISPSRVARGRDVDICIRVIEIMFEIPSKQYFIVLFGTAIAAYILKIFQIIPICIHDK